MNTNKAFIIEYESFTLSKLYNMYTYTSEKYVIYIYTHCFSYFNYTIFSITAPINENIQ